MEKTRYRPVAPTHVKRLDELCLQGRFTAWEEATLRSLIRREALDADEAERIFGQGLRSVFVRAPYPGSVVPCGSCGERRAAAEALWDRGIGHVRHTFFDEYLETVPACDVAASVAFPLVALVDPAETVQAACVAGRIGNLQDAYGMEDDGYGGSDRSRPYWISAQVGMRHAGIAPASFMRIHDAAEIPLSACEGAYLAIQYPGVFRGRNVDLARTVFVERPAYIATLESWGGLQPPVISWRWVGEARPSFCLATRQNS